jgi:GxxExxY protein
MAIARHQAGLSVTRQVAVDVVFRGLRIGTFRADLIVGGELLVELKAIRAVEEAHISQVLNYLRATRLEAGLLLNFGPRPQLRRVVYSNERKASVRV